MSQLQIIECYECEESLSLDKGYLEKLAGGKFKVKTVFALISEEALCKLNEVNLRRFEFSKYHRYLEQDKQAQADEYFLRNGKCISKDSFGVRTFSTMEQLNQYLEDEK